MPEPALESGELWAIVAVSMPVEVDGCGPCLRSRQVLFDLEVHKCQRLLIQLYTNAWSNFRHVSRDPILEDALVPTSILIGAVFYLWTSIVEWVDFIGWGILAILVPAALRNGRVGVVSGDAQSLKRPRTRKWTRPASIIVDLGDLRPRTNQHAMSKEFLESPA
jgi:hypothetical protein